MFSRILSATCKKLTVVKLLGIEVGDDYGNHGFGVLRVGNPCQKTPYLL
jgi:hypothetical protein